MSAEQNETAVDTSSGGGGGTSKIVVIASLVNMVATVGIVAVLFLAHQKEKSKPTVEDIVSGQASSSGAGAHGSGSGQGADKAEGAGDGGQGDKAAVAVNDSGKIIPLEPFTVNLTTGIGTQPRYVRMNISVELEQGATEKEFDIKLPRVRDTIINLLNSKKVAEINAVEGREQLKDEIRRSVNTFMLQSKVKGVYFTNFAVSN